MATASITHLTPAEYLEIERKADFRSEFLNGAMFAMAGASVSHNRIVSNALFHLRLALQGKDCDVLSNDLRIYVPATGLYTYPDISVVCGRLEFAGANQDTVTNPILLIEVLSESTKHYDRVEKFRHYRTIPSFREYLLLAQDEVRAEHHIRQDDGSWSFREFTSAEDSITLSSIDCTLTLASAYERVEFSPTP